MPHNSPTGWAILLDLLLGAAAVSTRPLAP